MVVNPAKSHPDVIVAAVAARDIERAKKYAETHGIPIVHASYQGTDTPFPKYTHSTRLLIVNFSNRADR